MADCSFLFEIQWDACHGIGATGKGVAALQQLHTVRINAVECHLDDNSLPRLDNPMSTPSVQAIKRALAIAEQIQNLEAELAGILGQVPKASKPTVAVVVASAPTAAPKRKYTMSAAHRPAVASAQKARWAKVKGAKVQTKPAAKEKKPAPKRKGKMSAAGRAAIAAAQKKRWAKVKAGKAGKNG